VTAQRKKGLRLTFGKYLVSSPTVLLRAGTDIVSFKLHTPSPFPEMGYEAHLTIEARKGHGQAWLKEVFDIEDVEIIDSQTGRRWNPSK
jgi:hypothetical protein